MKYLKKYKYQITALLIVIIIIYILLIKHDLLTNSTNQEIEYEKEITKVNSENDNNSTCNIDIKGAIINPGVYLVDCHKNVSDVINIAGGLKEEADTSTINLAKRISDEMVIVIYTKEEIATAIKEKNTPITIEKECICPEIKNDACIEKTDGVSNGKLININTASKEELKTIPGIGDSKAEAIIKYRNEVGNFKDISELKNVNGIGEKLYEEIKIYLTR